MQSGTSLLKFNPNAIPYQIKVVNLIRRDWDYSTGTPEILLSGSYGCLRADSLVETASGKVPISCITKSHYLLSFDHSRNQFVYQQGSDAFPKGKGILYRVTSEHGEFVASGNHRISTLSGNYLRVDSLSVEDEILGLSFFQEQKCLSFGQKWSLGDVLGCFGTLSSLIQNYEERIRQYDPQLHLVLGTFLNDFPLLGDALKHGQFSYKNNILHKDDLLEQETKHAHIFELLCHTYKNHSKYLSGHPALAEAMKDICSKFSERTFLDTLQEMLFLSQNDHPIILLLNLYHIYNSCYSILCSQVLPNVPKASKILKIENIGEDWYWDIQVPNTNNYVCSGHVHHNSAKSILMAHLAVTHCLFNPGARVLLARKALPDLKSTIYKEIIEHIADDLVEGKDYFLNDSIAMIRFSNGSEIISRSWSDKRYKKGRSLKISFLVFEELTENNEEDKEAFLTLKARLRRIPNVKENVLIAATNPDSKSHWVYRYFFDESKDTRFVFKSVTTDNPFLDPIYIKQLKEDLDPISAQRYIYGEWVDLNKERVYYAYNRDKNFKKEFNLPINELILTHDFNIGHNKPMSAAAGALIDGYYHFFKSFHVESARTADIMEEIASSGVLDNCKKIIVYGDASGKNKDTRSIKSDYDIIKSFLSNYKTKDNRSPVFEMRVPLANPPIRRRHNIVNAHFLNENKQVRLFIYDEWLNDGFSQTSFKKGADLLEDDSLPQQHVTTAIGYVIDYDKYRTTGTSNTIQL